MASQLKILATWQFFMSCISTLHFSSDSFLLFNTYSMKRPDLYYFETIKMTSQAWSNLVWRMRAAGKYSL